MQHENHGKQGDMCLNTKKDSRDGFEFEEGFSFHSSGLPKLPKPRQSQNQGPDPLPCPRCGSGNTKFCYYNNYKKSQPRHFCKACKRHWTKGGILRNVPAGGGRRNKRIKLATGTSSISTGSTEKHFRQQMNNLSYSLGDQNDILGILSCGSTSRGDDVNSTNISNHNSALPLSLSHNHVPSLTFSSLGPFGIESNNVSLNGDHNLVGLASLEDKITVLPSTTRFTSQTSSSGIDVPSYWNSDDLDPFVLADQFYRSWDDNHETEPNVQSY